MVARQVSFPTSRMRFVDLLHSGGSRLFTRKFRSALSAIGISVGIAAMVSVLGLSASSRADLIAQLDALGTNMLTVEAAQGLGRGSGVLPVEAPGMVGRINPVEEVSAIVSVPGSVRRTDLIPATQTGGISIVAADTNLLDTLNGTLADGAFLNDATALFPNVVLGRTAADRLGIDDVSGGKRVWINDQWYTVVGILDPLPLAPSLDRAAIVGMPAAREFLGADEHPGTLYVRTEPDDLDAVRRVLPATVNPEYPDEVGVSRPSDALEAKAATENAYTSLFLGLGAVALLVGGVGIANVMVVAVIERRNEIGLRRALGATRGHIRQQFLIEALVLATLGGVSGVLLGSLVIAGYAASQGWAAVIPLTVIGAGLFSAVVVGALAGIYPAMRAARLSPTEALRVV